MKMRLIRDVLRFFGLGGGPKMSSETQYADLLRAISSPEKIQATNAKAFQIIVKRTGSLRGRPTLLKRLLRLM